MGKFIASPWVGGQREGPFLIKPDLGLKLICFVVCLGEILVRLQMIYEFNHSLLTYGDMIGKLVGEALIFPKDMKIEDLWKEVLVTNPIIDSFTTGRVMIVS